MKATSHAVVSVVAVFAGSQALAATGPGANPSTELARAAGAPVAVRGVMSVNGVLVGTTPWMDGGLAVGNGAADAGGVYAFDAYDSFSGKPGDVPDGTRIVSLTPAAKWREDVTVADGYGGLQAKYIDLVYHVNNAYCGYSPNPDLFITILSFEADATKECLGEVKFYEGVQFAYKQHPEGLFYANFDLTQSPLWVQLPKDGIGGVEIVLSRDEKALEMACAQPAQWATGDVSTPPEPRAGTSGQFSLVDFGTWSTPCEGEPKYISDGLLSLPCECIETLWTPYYKYSSACIGLGVVDESCYPDCDQSGELNIDDFVCFQTLYALGDPAADCDGNGSLDIDDFVCFQTFYAIGC